MFYGEPRQAIGAAPCADAAGDTDHDKRVEGQAVAVVHAGLFSFCSTASPTNGDSQHQAAWLRRDKEATLGEHSNGEGFKGLRVRSRPEAEVHPHGGLGGVPRKAVTSEEFYSRLRLMKFGVDPKIHEQSDSYKAPGFSDLRLAIRS
jgi:hypothetical protein